MCKLFTNELNAVVDQADDLDETRAKLQEGKYDVILVNRVLAMTGGSGLEVIESLAKEGVPTKMMLVSDREDAQQEAISRGAVQGFGKAKLHDRETLELICNTARGSA